jgi:hypothetical protein
MAECLCHSGCVDSGVAQAVLNGSVGCPFEQFGCAGCARESVSLECLHVAHRPPRSV